MKKYKKVVLKLGSALISESNSTSSEMIKDLSSQISLLHHDTQFIIVTSGAISQGMNILGINDKPKDLESLQALAAIGQQQLMGLYEKSFKNFDILTAQVLLTHDDMNDHSKYNNANATIEKLLNLNVIPIINENETDKTYENERETKLEDGGSAGDSSEKPVEQSAVQEDNKQEDNSKQIEEYSEGVKKRIAKLTKRMREAERQKEEALRYADSIKKERDQFKTTADSLDKNYVAEMEGRITSSIAAAQEKLRAARQAEDPKAETEALAAISQLGYCLLYTSPSPRDS